MKIYHSTTPMDGFKAREVVSLHMAAVEQAGGHISSPNGPVEPPAIVVLELPEGILPQDVVPGIEFVEFVPPTEETTL